MRILSFFVLCVIIVFSGCQGCHVKNSCSGVQGTGPVRSDIRTLPPFSKIQLANGVDVDVKVGPSQQVTVEALDNLLPLILTEVKDGWLVISNSESFCSNKKPRIIVTVPHLTEIHSASSGNMVIDGVKEPTFQATLESSGDVHLSGTAQTFFASVSSSGDLNAQRLETESSTVRVSGSGDAQVFVSGNLQVELTSSGDLSLRGKIASLNASLSGSGDLKASSVKVSRADVRITSSGSAHLSIAGDVQAVLMGSGSLTLDGKANLLKATLTSSGHLQAKSLEADRVELDVSGSGDATVCVREEALGEALGSGDITLLCHPKVMNVKKSGSGQVSVR